MEQSGKKNQNLRRLIKRMMAFKSHIGVILICLVLTAGATFARPLIIRGITDDGMSEGNMRVIILFSLVLLVLSIGEQVLNLLQSRFFVGLQNKFQLSLYKESFGKLMRLKMGYFTDTNSNEIINRVSTDISTVGGMADQGILFVVSFVLTITGGLVGLFVISWKMALVVICVIPIKYITAKILADRQRKITEGYIEDARMFYGWFGEAINGIREIKLWNLQQKKFDEFMKKQSQLLRSNKEMAMIGSYNGAVNNLLEWVMTSALYIMGGYLLVRGEMTLGGVIAFISYSNYVTGPISSILQLRFIFAHIAPSMDRLFQMLDMEEEADDGQLTGGQATIKRVDLESLSFSYSPERSLLRDIDLTISAGEKIAVIGQNGSGKTTLMNLLLRLEEPQEGRICIDGVDAKAYDLAAYRDLFAVVSQRPYLFGDSVGGNIDLSGSASAQAVERACELSGVNSWLSRLPDGLDSRVGSDGSNLSGGERQKLAVARAMVKDAPIIILDEANSSMDVESDDGLYHSIFQEFKDKTVILITHNYKHLDDFDRIYRLEEGRLVERKRDEQ